MWLRFGLLFVLSSAWVDDFGVRMDAKLLLNGDGAISNVV